MGPSNSLPQPSELWFTHKSAPYGFAYNFIKKYLFFITGPKRTILGLQGSFHTSLRPNEPWLFHLPTARQFAFIFVEKCLFFTLKWEGAVLRLICPARPPALAHWGFGHSLGVGYIVYSCSTLPPPLFLPQIPRFRYPPKTYLKYVFDFSQRPGCCAPGMFRTFFDAIFVISKVKNPRETISIAF